jgi:hypothetical protein
VPLASFKNAVITAISDIVKFTENFDADGKSDINISTCFGLIDSINGVTSVCSTCGSIGGDEGDGNTGDCNTGDGNNGISVSTATTTCSNSVESSVGNIVVLFDSII